MADREWGVLSPHQIAGAQALLPDPITCYSESRYVQRQKVALDVGGSVVSVDWLTAGRFANGERWDFERRVIALVLEYGTRPNISESHSETPEH